MPVNWLREKKNYLYFEYQLLVSLFWWMIKTVSTLRILFKAALYVVFLSLLIATAVRAELSDTEEMRQVCENWLSYCASQPGAWAGSTKPSITGSEDILANDTLIARCYHIAPRGFVIVPVLKELPPVKAYSDESNLNPSDTVGLAGLIREVLHHRTSLYVTAFGSLEASQPTDQEVLLDRRHRDSWDLMSVSSKEFTSSRALDVMGGRATGGPLLTTVWHQGWPYNNYCPPGNGGQLTYVGCVATAMAQILTY